jgi:hypothetical protein
MRIARNMNRSHDNSSLVRTVVHPRALPCEEPFLFEPPRRRILCLWPPLRNFLNMIGFAGVITLTGGYTWAFSPFRVEYPEVPMPLRDLPASFEGFRMVQITDLHTGRTAPVSFLRKVIHRVNQMNCDLVVVTGDLVSSRLGGVGPACELLGELNKPTIVTFGNHDYADRKQAWESTKIADALQANLEYRGITVLRNRAVSIERPDGRIWIVGMEDLWSARFSPRQAFSGIRTPGPIIALSHNPDTAEAMAHFGANWIIAGHTHGGQIRLPVLGSLTMPMRNKHLNRGLFRIGQASLYVCRGIGFRLRVRFRCPPEVPCFVLQRDNS